MNEILSRWNGLELEEAAQEILACCGSKAWARGMAERRPLLDDRTLLSASDEVWGKLSELDWMEAFRSHPRIGESHGAASAPARSVAWSSEEQRNVSAADDRIKMELVEGNRAYEEKFDRIFIVCATGKASTEILQILQRRLRNDPATEFREAAEQQRLIAQIRLKKWLQG